MKRVIIVCISLFSSVFIYGQVTELTPEARRHFEQAGKYVEMAQTAVDYKKAVDEFEIVLKTAATDADVWYRLALCCEAVAKDDRSYYKRSVDAYRKVLEYGDNLLDAAKKKELKDKIEDLEYAVKLLTKARKSGIYQIGDTIHFQGGSVGIVFSVSDGGRHGKAVEFGSRAANWLSKRLYDGHYSDGRSIPIDNFWMYRTEATSETNGKDNTDKIVNAARRIEAKTGEKLGGHEFIKVLLESGMYEAGWYVPAIKEIEELYTAIAQENLKELISKWINCAPFKQYYHSSTEIKDPEHKHLFTHYEAFSMISGNSFSIDKSFGKYAVRYIHAF